MGLLEDIEKEIKSLRISKWKILKERAEKEIFLMIANSVSIDTQIELIIKNKIVEKLDRKEYTNIITKHFGYQKLEARGKNKNQSKKIVQKKMQVEPKNIPMQTKNPAPKKRSVQDRLSEDIDLMQFKNS